MMIQVYRQAGERWKMAYEEQHAEFMTTAETLTERLAALEQQIAEERKAWRASERRARWNALALIVVAGVVFQAARR